MIGDDPARDIAILYGFYAGLFCLLMATLLITLKLWLDVYHHRWLAAIDELMDEVKKTK